MAGSQCARRVETGMVGRVRQSNDSALSLGLICSGKTSRQSEKFLLELSWMQHFGLFSFFVFDSEDVSFLPNCSHFSMLFSFLFDFWVQCCMGSIRDSEKCWPVFKNILWRLEISKYFWHTFSARDFYSKPHFPRRKKYGLENYDHFEEAGGTGSVHCSGRPGSVGENDAVNPTSGRTAETRRDDGIYSLSRYLFAASLLFFRLFQPWNVMLPYELCWLLCRDR